MTVLASRPSSRTSTRPSSRSASSLRAPGLDWVLMLAALTLVSLGTLLVWSATSTRADLTGGDPNAYLRKQLVNVAIGLVLAVPLTTGIAAPTVSKARGSVGAAPPAAAD